MLNDPEIMKKMADLDCEFQITYAGPTFVFDPLTRQMVPSTDPNIRQPGCYCTLIDKPTGESYVTGYGSGTDEIGALKDALAKAVTATKPLTKAQKITAEAVGNVIADKDAIIADLQRQLAEASKPKQPKREPASV